MPKVRMEFTLPEERNELVIAQKGIDFYCAILEIQKLVRCHEKYGMDVDEMIKGIREEIQECNLEEVE
jgi:hypothetical protein